MFRFFYLILFLYFFQSNTSSLERKPPSSIKANNLNFLFSTDMLKKVSYNQFIHFFLQKKNLLIIGKNDYDFIEKAILDYSIKSKKSESQKSNIILFLSALKKVAIGNSKDSKTEIDHFNNKKKESERNWVDTLSNPTRLMETLFSQPTQKVIRDSIEHPLIKNVLSTMPQTIQNYAEPENIAKKIFKNINPLNTILYSIETIILLVVLIRNYRPNDNKNFLLTILKILPISGILSVIIHNRILLQHILFFIISEDIVKSKKTKAIVNLLTIILDNNIFFISSILLIIKAKQYNIINVIKNFDLLETKNNIKKFKKDFSGQTIIKYIKSIEINTYKNWLFHIALFGLSSSIKYYSPFERLKKSVFSDAYFFIPEHVSLEYRIYPDALSYAEAKIFEANPIISVSDQETTKKEMLRKIEEKESENSSLEEDVKNIGKFSDDMTFHLSNNIINPEDNIPPVYNFEIYKDGSLNKVNLLKTVLVSILLELTTCFLIEGKNIKNIKDVLSLTENAELPQIIECYELLEKILDKTLQSFSTTQHERIIHLKKNFNGIKEILKAEWFSYEEQRAEERAEQEAHLPIALFKIYEVEEEKEEEKEEAIE